MRVYQSVYFSFHTDKKALSLYLRNKHVWVLLPQDVNNPSAGCIVLSFDAKVKQDL